MLSAQHCAGSALRNLRPGSLRWVLRFTANGQMAEANAGHCWTSWSNQMVIRQVVVKCFVYYSCLTHSYVQWARWFFELSDLGDLWLQKEIFKKEVEHIQKKTRKNTLQVEKGFYSKEKMKTDLKWSATLVSTGLQKLCFMVCISCILVILELPIYLSIFPFVIEESYQSSSQVLLRQVPR